MQAEFPEPEGLKQKHSQNKAAICLAAAFAAELSTAGCLAHEYAAPQGQHSRVEPENFLFLSDLSASKNTLARPDIGGAQVVYNWDELEPTKDKYDFTGIEKDLQLANSMHKKLFIQIQDRFFEPKAKHVPDYLQKDPVYGGGITPQFDNPGDNKPLTTGWATLQWNPAVQLRYQKLLQALSAQFDGRVFGINLPETAIDIDIKKDRTGFSSDLYFAAEMENLRVARQTFKKSYVVQYVNFWPDEWNNDHKYMSRLFEFASQNNIGLGGPDVIPYKKGQMENSYPFFHKYKDRLPIVAMAVQEPTLTYLNPETHKPFTKGEFGSFARDYLGARIVFWTTSAPWLNAVKP